MELINGNQNTINAIVDINNWSQINDDCEIEKLCEVVIANQTDWVRQYRSGKTKIFKALMGHIASTTQNRANMGKITIKLKELLNKN